MLKKISLVLLLAFIFGVQGNTQSSYKDSIEVVKDFFVGLKFFQHDKRLTMGQLSAELRSNPEAFKYLNKARTNKTIATITSFIGGFLVGYELGRALAGEDINWAVMGSGAGIIVLSLPLEGAFKRNARKAVHIYNAAYR